MGINDWKKYDYKYMGVYLIDPHLYKSVRESNLMGSGEGSVEIKETVQGYRFWPGMSEGCD